MGQISISKWARSLYQNQSSPAVTSGSDPEAHDRSKSKTVMFQSSPAVTSGSDLIWFVEAAGEYKFQSSPAVTSGSDVIE